MSEKLKFIPMPERSDGQASGSSACCGEEAKPKLTLLTPSPSVCCPPAPQKADWIVGTVSTAAGLAASISGRLTSKDRWEHLKCRISSFRNRFTVSPGLYAIGRPTPDSEVFVSANYKLSFDKLREAVAGISAWILVLDTRGINVWCAAGKGTFGTDELVRQIGATGLAKVVTHRRLIVPQLGAVGVSAPQVLKRTGFRVLFGPVQASDIPAYIFAGRKATGEMRRIRFSAIDRLVLTPMEIIPAMKHYPLFALAVLLVCGLRPQGIMFADAVSGGLPLLLLGLIAILAGAFISPMLLPVLPFRAFSLKGLVAGGIATALFLKFSGTAELSHPLLLVSAGLFFPMAASYIALQFTGSTTFTHMSGVKKELKVMVPVYLAATGLSAILLIVHRIMAWRIS